MSDFAQTVKQQADIVKVIGGYIRLRKAGAQNYSGLCPFHKEKSPSFSVHAGRQFYHCFGCGQSGDVFSFVGKIENAGFPEAVRIVAQKCGIPLPKREYNSPEEAAEAGLRRRLLDLHEAATLWFQEQLQSPEGAFAREYLTGRGVTPEAIKTFRIGFSPDNFNGLRDRLSPTSDAETLRASGLFSSKDSEDLGGNVVQGRLYDRFRKRVMFPIANESGRVIAFTARTLDTGDKAGPKYINSPETPLYSKGQVLFNLDKAKAAIRQFEFALLVEGQMDCISVYMRGIQNVIATSGTAFTEQQVGLLRRQTTNVVVNFDPDTAGANAAEKSIGLLTEEGFTIKVVTLDGGLDPDRFIRERGVEAYVAAIKGARRHSDYLIERARQQFLGSGVNSKVAAINYLLPHISRIPHPQTRIDFADEAVDKLKIDSSALRDMARQAARRGKTTLEAAIAQKTHQASKNAPPGFKSDVLNEHLLAAYEGGEIGRIALAAVLTEVERILLRALASQESCWFVASKAVAEHPDWFDHLSTFPALVALAKTQDKDPIGLIQDPTQRTLIAQALLTEGSVPAESDINDVLHGLRVRQLEREQRVLRGHISTAEARGDLAEVVLLTQQKMELDRELRKLHHQ